MAKLSKKKFLIILFFLGILIGAAAYFIWGREKESPYQFAAVQIGEVIQEVSLTGRVKPSKDVDLAFEKTGKLTGVYVDVGDEVYAGQVLARLNSADEQANLEAAQAVLAIERANLEELKKGTRPEEVSVYQTKAENARAAITDSKQNLLDKLQDSYTKSDDAVRNNCDQLFSNPRGDNPQLKYISGDSNMDLEIENERFLLESFFENWNNTLAQQNISTDLLSFTGTTKSNLSRVKSFLEKVSLYVNGLFSGSSLSQTTIDTWRSNVSTARTNVNTAVTNLSAAEEEMKDSESALSLAEQELELKKAGTVEEKIVAQEATVEKAEADVRKYESELVKTVLISPITGTVTKQDAEVGEIVSANTLIISIISQNHLQVEVSIPEVDIAKVEIGDKAEVTLDAYGEEVIFEAAVVEIEPAETVIEGVSTYKTTLQFVNGDPRVKSGMTANIDMVTDKREGVLLLPQRAVITKNGNKIVRIMEGEEVIEKEVELGLKGSFGMVEILSGVEEGDEVIVFVKK